MKLILEEGEDVQNKILDYLISICKKDIRPWGKFRSYPHSQARSIKIITANPGQALFFQDHNRRSKF